MSLIPRRLRRLGRDERGISIILTSLGFMAFMAATMLAIDVGLLMTARSQAQNAADAGALAGATSLVFDDWFNRSSTGPAVTSAISAMHANPVVGQAPSILPADVTFPNDPAGNPTRVATQTFRSTARNNPIPTLIGPLFGIPTASLGATATAEASPANAATCLMPFTIPDKWTENSDAAGNPDGPWNPNLTFDLYYTNGKPLPNPDVYIGPSDPVNYTGYNATRDKGLEIALKQNNTSKVTPSWYNPWDLPGSIGANDYRNNIQGCNAAVVDVGDTPPPQNGNMTGPTLQGTQTLVDQDPHAYWDTSCSCVQGSAYGGRSPRIVAVPVYDPVVFANGPSSGKNIDIQFTNFVGFFIEGIQGGQVLGRITPITGLLDTNAGPAPPGSFARVIRLVQ